MSLATSLRRAASALLTMSPHCRTAVRAISSAVPPASAADASSGNAPAELHDAALSSDEHQRHRLAVFQEEFERQRKRAKRSVDKIEVLYTGADGQKHSLFMNKGVSTPLDAARHLSDELSSESVLALVNSAPWDMHRPLAASCSIAFLNFKTPGSKEEAEGIKLCNTALWRSGSLILGSVFETAFKESYSVRLISFPTPYIKSGSFVYDCQVTRRGRPLVWEPSKPELRALSLAAEKLLAADHAFQPMDAPGPIAMEIFKHSDTKLAALRSMLQSRPADAQWVTVYRVGDFVDLSSGPMISRTGLVGRFAFAAVHQISTPDYGQLMRVQGLAVPRAFLTHFSSVEILEHRAAVLNRAFLPTRSGAVRAPPQAPKAAASTADGS